MIVRGGGGEGRGGKRRRVVVIQRERERERERYGRAGLQHTYVRQEMRSKGPRVFVSSSTKGVEEAQHAFVFRGGSLGWF